VANPLRLQKPSESALRRPTEPAAVTRNVAPVPNNDLLCHHRQLLAIVNTMSAVVRARNQLQPVEPLLVSEVSFCPKPLRS
jgi:hypothetical protein